MVHESLPVQGEPLRPSLSGGRVVHEPALALAAVGVLLATVAGALLAGRAAERDRGAAAVPVEHTALATFAGGCFWCIEDAFDKVPGVVEAVSGYSGGTQPRPSYEQVASGRTDHLESVQVRYDPARVSYRELLEVFWRQIDPTDDGGQFADRGAHYSTAIFVHDAGQRRLAEASRAALARSGRFDRPIVTRIVDATAFYPAEAHHQDYSAENPLRYQAYKRGSGRASFIDQTWAGDRKPILGPASAGAEEATTARDLDCSGQAVPRAEEIPMKPQASELRQRLTPLQYRVTQEEGTEPPFDNTYWNEHREGIYVDVVSGEPLFSSTDKFDSGTGWPSFTRPIDRGSVREREDRSLWMARTEVRSARGDSHLGHLFDDGPAPTGQRYCINSAALRFVPRDDLEREGYGEYLRLFDGPSR